MKIAQLTQKTIQMILEHVKRTERRLHDLVEIKSGGEKHD